ncbi:HAD family hydrolase [Clostridium sp. JNZ X4-2]
MIIDAVIFDMDGVIIDSEPLHKKLNDQLLAEYGVKMSKEEQLGFIGTTNYYEWKTIKRRYNLSNSLEELVKRDRDLYLTNLKRNKDIKPIEGVGELIKFLYSKDLKLAVASSSPINVIEIVIKRFKLEEYFCQLVTGDDVKKSKPAPDIFLRTAKLLGARPDHCIVIEDSKNGVEASKKAGMYCMAFKNLNSGDQELSKADFICDSFYCMLREFKKIVF